MTVSAHDVAAVLRERIPDLGVIKQHKLLYYCQGHHLAAFGVPLFSETISAWDGGPVVGTLWHAEKYGTDPPSEGESRPLTEGELNTIGYVLSRYGRATGSDLSHMTHAEDPYKFANAHRPPGTSSVIRQEWMLEYFRGEGAPGAGEDEVPLDSEVVTDWLRKAAARPVSDREDTLEELQAWAARGA